MSEIFDPTSQEPAVESSRKTISAFGTRAKEQLLAQVKQEPAKTFLIILAGSILTSFSRLLHLAYGGRVQAAPLDRRLDAGNDELDPGARSEDRRSD